MNTIEERVAGIRSRQARMAIRPRQSDYDAQETACGAIVAGWNAALKAMKAVDVQSSFRYTDWQKCHLCGYSTTGHGTHCPIPALQAAIANMEG